MKIYRILECGEIKQSRDQLVVHRYIQPIEMQSIGTPVRGDQIYLRPMKKSEIKNYFSKLGKKKSPAKAAAAKANGAKGGRKPKIKPDLSNPDYFFQ